MFLPTGSDKGVKQAQTCHRHKQTRHEWRWRWRPLFTRAGQFQFQVHHVEQLAVTVLHTLAPMETWVSKQKQCEQHDDKAITKHTVLPGTTVRMRNDKLSTSLVIELSKERVWDLVWVFATRTRSWSCNGYTHTLANTHINGQFHCNL